MGRDVVVELWFVVEPSDDVSDEWVGRCLDLDVVTQGRSAPHAWSMLCEACGMVLRDDLAAGRCSRDRRAPMDQWEYLGRLLREASLRPPGDVRSHIYLTRIGVGGDGSATITSLKILSERGSLGQREERIIR